MPISPNHTSRKKLGIPVQKVMIADDHDIFRHGLKDLLRKYAFIKVVGEAKGGNDLMKLISTDPPDLVFLDLHMPNGDGIEVTDLIRKLYKKTRVVILSQYDDAVTIERMMKLGAAAYLTKTITTQVLNNLFEKLLKDEVFVSAEASENLGAHKMTPVPPFLLDAQVQWINEEITMAERKVLRMMMRGYTHKQIASELGLSPRTIETQRERLMKKLGARNSAELITIALEYKIIL